ncbi:MAG TPA: ferredoxin [Mycobacterium sp.]
MRIAADRATCIGAGMCVMTAEAFFDQDDAGLVVVVTGEVPGAECQRVRAAVNGCPSGALRVPEQ